MRDFEEGEICPVCEKGTMKKVIEDEVLEYYVPPITIPDLESFVCTLCGESFFTNESSDRFSKIFEENRNAKKLRTMP